MDEAMTATEGTRFVLPDELQAREPPEARGLRRDGVRMLVAASAGLRHLRFADLPTVLVPGDLVVVNNSATLPAAVPGSRLATRNGSSTFSLAVSSDSRP